jgi:hypothetical protein
VRCRSHSRASIAATLRASAAASGRGLRAAPAAVLAALLASAGAAARAEDPTPPEDPIVIPEVAVEVERVRLRGRQSWVPLNRRMLLVELGSRDYLFVFHSTCSNLARRNAVVSTRTGDATLAPHDSIYVSDGSAQSRADTPAYALGTAGEPCRIDRMYSILEEDRKALHEQFDR